MPKYEVIVGNIGTVYSGDNFLLAMSSYDTYHTQSRDGYGRAAGEPVTLMKDGEPWREHFLQEASDADKRPTD